MAMRRQKTHRFRRFARAARQETAPGPGRRPFLAFLSGGQHPTPPLQPQSGRSQPVCARRTRTVSGEPGEQVALRAPRRRQRLGDRRRQRKRGGLAPLQHGFNEIWGQEGERQDLARVAWADLFASRDGAQRWRVRGGELLGPTPGRNDGAKERAIDPRRRRFAGAGDERAGALGALQLQRRFEAHAVVRCSHVGQGEAGGLDRVSVEIKRQPVRMDHDPLERAGAAAQGLVAGAPIAAKQGLDQVDDGLFQFRGRLTANAAARLAGVDRGGDVME